MKLQNLAIIFIVIFIPLLLVLSYYLDQQRDTLALQAEYDLKLSEATKEGIKAFEINTVDWASTKQTYARNNAKATINTFITSLANNLNISGTAREYMLDYIPAVALTMYDGYYVYAPAYTSVTIKNENGVQLFLNGTEITTDSDGEIIYEPKSGVSGNTATYTYTNSAGNLETNNITYTTSKDDAKKEYKHTLNNKTAYTEEYVKGNNTYIVNYTLDNKISVYKIDNAGNTEQKTGYLVYFNEDTTNQTILPRIKINGDNTISPVNTTSIVSNIQYSKSDNETTKIQPETLTEQILYKDLATGEPQLGTFKYVYTTTNEKLYYDGNFFKLKNNVREYLSNSNSIKVGDDGCYYKSLSLLIGEGETKEFKKIYQVLNGRDKGNWYMDLRDDDETDGKDGKLDTEIKKEDLPKLGIDTVIYKNYSDINYYVEAYAFTNWVKEELGTGDLKQKKLEYKLDSITNKFEPEYTEITSTNIFTISKTNNPEDETSIFVEHKKEVMKDSINTNLNAAISSYNRNGNYDFKLPILTDGDWEQIFSNISLITFFQGVPIGLKYYNNYAIATSTTNREYVDPNEIFFTGTTDEKYHQVYCEHCLEEKYTGYRSTEYTLREYKYEETKHKYYYQHDNYVEDNASSEIGCYYCIINKANYTQTSDAEITYLQTKSYNEALARERYYQNEKVTAKVGIRITYHLGVTGWSDVKEESKVGYPKQQEADVGQSAVISLDKPSIESTDPFVKYVFVGWAEEENSTEVKYYPGAITDILEEDLDLYAVWRISLPELPWNFDYKWSETAPKDGFDNGTVNKNGQWTGSWASGIYDGSISYIRVVEGDDGAKIQMVGNSVKPGKGAIWAEFTSDYLDIAEYQFDYNINKGDSFNAGGFMFNIIETDTTLEGYMLSINFAGNFLSKSNANGAIYKFTYKKNSNNTNVENIELIQSLQIGGYSGIAGSNGNGTITIKITDTGYIVSGTELTNDVIIKVDNLKPNKFGFFSDHYSHSCNRIGYFELNNVKVTVVRNK